MKKTTQLIHKKHLLILTLLLLQTFVSFGQDLKYVYGKVVDSKTGAPLAFASIVEKNKSVGLITNSDGSFKVPGYYYTANVTLEISFIGYYSEEVNVRDLKRNDLNIIKLIDKSEFLDEIVIGKKPKQKRSLTAKEIVRLAIENIDNNYPQDDFSYVGYYRDYQKDKENAYLNLNEAILQVYDPGFPQDDFEHTTTRMFQYSKNTDFPRDSLAAKLYDYREKTKFNKNAVLNDLGEQGNEFTLLRFHDAIRNYNVNTYDYVNRFEVDFIYNHQFEIVKETSLNDVDLYEIKFWRNLKKVLVEGRIFISTIDYKIYKLQYSVYKIKSQKDDSKSGHYMRKLSTKYEKEELIYNVLVEYNDYADIMYPRYISFNNPFNLIKPPKFFPTKANFLHKREIEQPITISIDLLFNNKVSKKSGNKKKNYKLSYKGKNIRIDRVVVDDTKPKVTIYPNEIDIIFYREAWENGQKLPTEDFIIDVKNIKDIYGNVVLENEVVTYDQYREFFIQELNLNLIKPKDTLFMIKTKPIFEDQPILETKEMSQYWMNTPLKKE